MCLFKKNNYPTTETHYLHTYTKRQIELKNIQRYRAGYIES